MKRSVRRHYREKRLHDEASALGHARREGIAEGMEQRLQKGIAQGPEKGKRDTIARMRSLGISEEQIRLIYGDTDI
ncbi:MAG: hypothetical protein IKR73_05045 [Oscillospiraceae bacterium]|nr:hypothetical protein [Oscillospiraceae bacterium]